jgi:hypothetical protein
MRFSPVFALLTPILLMADEGAPRSNVSEIVARMDARQARQNAALCSYSATETYTLINKHLDLTPQMKVRLTFHRGEGKHFTVVSMPSNTIARRLFEDLLGEQTAAQRDRAFDIVDANYDFKLLGQERCGKRECYKLQLVPRHKSKFLVDGFAWVDTQTYAVLRVCGHLAKSPSFWVKAPEIDLQFALVDGVWMPVSDRSSTHVLFFGEAELTIAYADYRVKACSSTADPRDDVAR